MSVTIKGVDELVRKLGQAAAIPVLRPPMNRSVLKLQRDMADYPPQRPGSSYVRTGTLGRTWTTRVTKLFGGLEGRAGNVTRYAPDVQSKRFQARVHQGRWQTDEQVLNKNMKSILDDFEKAIQEAIR